MEILQIQSETLTVPHVRAFKLQPPPIGPSLSIHAGGGPPVYSFPRRFVPHIIRYNIVYSRFLVLFAL